MDDQTKVTLAAAMVGGYVLGRTKKGKLAFTVATYLAGRRFGLEPRQLAAEGMRRLGENPHFAELQEQLRGEVLETGRQAVTAAANRSMNSLADAIGERTARLGELEEQEPEAEEEEEEEPEEEPEQEEPEEEPEQEEPEEEPEQEEPEEEPKRRARKGGPHKRSAPAKKAAPAKKKAAKKSAPPRKSAAKKTGTAKKTTSSKRTASKRAERRR